MPDRTTNPIGKTVQRGTICKDRWQATITVLAPDRIPTGATAPLFLTITWRDERGAAGRPSDAKPITLRFEPQRQTGGGDIVFDDANGEHEKGFATDITTTLTLFGKAASGGTQPDVALVVRVEDEEQARLPMSVGTPDLTVRIESASGGPPPNYLPLDHPERVKAVVSPNTPGTFRWFSPIANTLEFTDTTPPGEAQVRLRAAPPRGVRFLPAVVVFKPDGRDATYLGIHQFDARESIAFVMGAPEPLRRPNQFYRGAIAYLTLNPIGQLELDQRSLQEVKQYLENHPPANGLPWGDVHIVVHANEEGWMQTPIVPNGREADPLTLQRFAESGELRLPDNLLDRLSLLRIRGCAVGRSQEMMRALSKAFGGNDPQRPVVRAPKHLQAYEYAPRDFSPGGRAPTSADEYLLELFLLGFPSAQAPNNRDLRAQFQQAFPNVGIDWTRVAFEQRTRTFQVGDRGWRYIPLPDTDAQLAAIVRAVTGGGPVTNARITNRTTREEDGLRRTHLTVSYTQGGQDFSGLEFDAGPNPPTDAAGRLQLLRAELARELGPEVAERLFADFSWRPHVDDRAIGRGQRDFSITFDGSRTIFRFSRELTEPDPTRPGQRRRAHPPLTDLTHFGVEIPE